jgi:hypothetical protein
MPRRWVTPANALSRVAGRLPWRRVATGSAAGRPSSPVEQRRIHPVEARIVAWDGQCRCGPERQADERTPAASATPRRTPARAHSCGSSMRRLYGAVERMCHLGRDPGRNNGTLLLCAFSASTTAIGGLASRSPMRPACCPGRGRPSPERVVALMSRVARGRGRGACRGDDGLAGVVLGYPRTLGGESTDQTAAVTVWLTRFVR